MLNPRFSICIILTLLAACSVFTPVKLPNTSYYQIGLVNPTNQSVSCNDTTDKTSLQITRMTADAPFDTNRMVYSTSEFKFDTYAYNKWTTSPNVMLANVIEQQLSQSCQYRNVVNSDFMTTARYRLNTKLIELSQNIVNQQQSTIRLIILAQLVDNTTNEVVKSRTFVETIEANPTPEDFAIKTNQLTNKLLTDFLAWLK